MQKLTTLLGTSLLLLSLAAAPLQARSRELATVELAGDTVKALAGISFKCIPESLMRDAAGVAVIPNVLKAGFVVDGRFGRGVVLARQPDGCWSNPVFITLAGGGFGWQAGIQATDVVLVFKTRQSLDRILRGKGKLTLGGDVSVAAGPLGREAEAATDLRLKAEIFSYSRSRGLFAGVSLQGAALLVDCGANEAFYGLRGGHPGDVLTHPAATAAAVVQLKEQLNRLSGLPAPGTAGAAPSAGAGRPAAVAPG
jgi:lipid-binding SYLF domain-containing protein